MHELTQRLDKEGVFCMEEIIIKTDKLITAYMKERAEWLINKRGTSRDMRTEIYEAFGIEKESLYSKIFAVVNNGKQTTCPEEMQKVNDIAQIAKAHFKENPHELKEGD